MKTKHAVSCLTLIAAFGLAGSGLMADSSGNPGSPTPNSTSSPSPSATAPLSGTVQSVDTTTNSVQIKDTTGNLQTVKVDNNTQISREGSVVQLTELRTGDVVVIKNSNSTM